MVNTLMCGVSGCLFSPISDTGYLQFIFPSTIPVYMDQVPPPPPPYPHILVPPDCVIFLLFLYLE